MGSTLYNFCLQLSISFHFSQVCWMALVMTAAQQVNMMIMSSRFGKSWRNKPNILKGLKRDPLLSTCKQLKSIWWFQPIWKILLSNWIISQVGVKVFKTMNKKHHPEVVTVPGRGAGSWPGKKLENCFHHWHLLKWKYWTYQKRCVAGVFTINLANPKWPNVWNLPANWLQNSYCTHYI